MNARTILAAALLTIATAALTAQVDGKNETLRDPSLLVDTAPDVYRARFETSKGPFVIEVHREWAPLAADRFFNLVKSGFYDGNRFFRVRPGFVAQWGIQGDSFIQRAWRDANLKDEPVKQKEPDGRRIIREGNDYLQKEYPRLDLITSAHLTATLQ